MYELCPSTDHMYLKSDSTKVNLLGFKSRGSIVKQKVEMSGCTFSCEAGTQGTRCETSPPVCDRISPCTDKGKCDESGGTANCTCEKNYAGVSCQLIKDSCSADPCNPGGSCKTQTVGYRCECMDGYQGDDCKVESPLCGSGACSSGQSCEQEGRVEYCLCPAKQVSVGSACKDGSLDFDLWFDKGMVSVDVLSGQPFKLNSAGNMTVMFWIGLLTGVSSGTVFKIKNDMDSTAFLEVKTNNVSFKGNEIAMTVPSGKWNHIAVTWQSDGKYELIINGIKENGDTTPPAFQEKLLRLVFDSQFTGYVSQLTVWRDILLYTKILEAINNPQYLPSFDLALGWYDYSLTKSTWRLTPSRAMADGKLCDAQRIMDSTYKMAPPSNNCPESAIHKVSTSRTVQVRNVVPTITFGGQEPITDNLKGCIDKKLVYHPS
ncbi:sushi, von Willebrand factor type A, EGF and pentraxin domain-containing protein 1-like [Gigantopelta aegis]|uniref:sushi, von Willebrand factor type A, EGF and pentraxin domain-containing protein 1-like n=1 Tax=Gigantopelta aegis TaxID=1735272 RepID=UPI001B88B1D1|nr:sushi, von Willebrand factor type A, EGF and pentraxin domain-containing protein 1-like [Gigantopelta aegis]